MIPAPGVTEQIAEFMERAKDGFPNRDQLRATLIVRDPADSKKEFVLTDDDCNELGDVLRRSILRKMAGGVAYFDTRKGPTQ